MLAVSAQTLEALRVQSRPEFEETVRDILEDGYHHFLPCFPKSVQLLIVGNMLRRADRWDLTNRDSLFSFCELMIFIAPNFDENVQLNGWMRGQGGKLNFSLPSLRDIAPIEALESARSEASNWPLYCTQTVTGEAKPEQLAHAIEIILHDRRDCDDTFQSAYLAIQKTQFLGLSSVADGPLVVAACLSFYGPEFERLIWASDLFDGNRTVSQIIELFRLRLALDFGRFV